ncbi:hypothetical protein [Parafrankia discariae]|uniref:hypothetical protein n=1 Tax=Parafrankia discariae TaxID=365528 RepID=UPI0003A9CD52|nr:hypothetical protein [Parafrankia discariae]
MRRMTRARRAISIAVLVATGLLVGSVATASSAGAAPAAVVEGFSTPVSGRNGTTAFDGTFTTTGFEQRAGELVALGTVTGTATDTATGATEPVSQAVATPVTAAATPLGCDVLNLVLGPLHLDVLGLVVDLNQVVLNITAQAGLGNLVGNLLCGVTNLLDVLGVTQLLNILNLLLGLS